MTDLRRLQYLLAVARERNFTRERIEIRAREGVGLISTCWEVVATAPNGAALERYHMAMPQAGTDGNVEETIAGPLGSTGGSPLGEPQRDVTRHRPASSSG